MAPPINSNMYVTGVRTGSTIRCVQGISSLVTLVNRRVTVEEHQLGSGGLQICAFDVEPQNIDCLETDCQRQLLDISISAGRISTRYHTVSTVDRADPVAGRRRDYRY
jgi:hypothetical protein